MSSSKTCWIDISNQTVAVRLRHHAQARRIILRAHHHGAEFTLTMPPGVDEDEALDFARTQSGWIRRHLNKQAPAVRFEPGIQVPLRGEPHRLEHRPGRRGSVWVDAQRDETPSICVTGDLPHFERRLTDWLKRQARDDCSARAAHHAAALGVSYKRVSVRDQTSRWGSCSSGGTLSFSWRLVLAPPEVLDYVAAHEVAHLLEMNHSPAFWRLVSAQIADVATPRGWLKRNGAGLHRYGA